MKQKKNKNRGLNYIEQDYNQFFDIDKLLGNEINDVVPEREPWYWTNYPEYEPHKIIKTDETKK